MHCECLPSCFEMGGGQVLDAGCEGSGAGEVEGGGEHLLVLAANSLVLC